MLPTAMVLEIRRLLEEGELSYRTIATRLHVSRGVVANIANGRRGLYGSESNAGRSSVTQSLGIPARCRQCGGLVFEPCLLCRARAYRRRVEEERRLEPCETLAHRGQRCVA